MASRDLTPWRQGSVLRGEDAVRLGLFDEITTDKLVLVASHDCDIQNAKEAGVEVILARKIDSPRGDCLNGKNPRVLDLAAVDAGVGAISVEMSTKLTVSKDLLCEATPAADLSAANRRQLAEWLALRYRRAPFPDSLERRLRRARSVDGQKIIPGGTVAGLKKDRSLSKELHRIFAAEGHHLESIYFALEGNEMLELVPEADYQMRVVVVAKSGPLDEEDDRIAKASVIAEKIRGLFDFGDWSKEEGAIELIACVASSERAFSIFQANRMLRWHLDWLSDEGA